MPLTLQTPKTITKKLKATYNKALHLKNYIQNEPFILTIKFKRLSQKDIEENFNQIRDWIVELRESGFKIEFQTIEYRSLGRQSMPKVLVFNRDEFLRELGKEKKFKKHIELIDESLRLFPKLEELLEKKPQYIMEYDEVWSEILAVCRYFMAHSKPNCYIRELDIEWVDTKFIEGHKKIIDTFLSAIMQREPVRMAQNGFEKRYGLKYDLPTVRFRILDERFYICGLSDISLPINEFKQLDIGCQRVFVTENKINGLSFPSVKSAMVIFGLGYGVDTLRDVRWLKSKKISYWGDIDTHGFAILSQIRGYFSHVESMLMGEDEIKAFKHLAVREVDSKRFLGELGNLTNEESRVFENLKGNIYGKGFRLEQERIGFGVLERVLRCI